MTAKEMFDYEDWYLDIETDDEQIIYSYDILDNNTLGYVDSRNIIFYKNQSVIEFVGVGIITFELLQAINQQCKELGWLDE